MEQTPKPSRRTFLTVCTDGLLALIGLAIAVPAIRYFVGPLLGKGRAAASSPSFEAVVAIDELPDGEWKLIPLKVVQRDGWERKDVSHSVWVRRDGTSVPKFTVLSPICPHLGCHINWFPKKREFICPCHGGKYNANGDYLSGPPPRSMDPLQFEARGGELYVRWQDFETGVHQRVPVSA